MAEIGLQDVVEPGAGGCHAARADRGEDAVHSGDVFHIGVSARGLPLRLAGGVGRTVVQEIDIDTVGIVSGTDGGDGREGCLNFSPGPSHHAAAVVDEEDGVERAQEGILILWGSDSDGRDPGGRGAWIPNSIGR